MVTRPTTHRATTTVGELRAFFADDHVHMALLVDDGLLLATVERPDLDSATDDRAPVLPLAKLQGRTISPHAPVAAARMNMLRSGRRRLAVTTQENALLGLLCLKRNGSGFCSDENVSTRRSDLRSVPEGSKPTFRTTTARTGAANLTAPALERLPNKCPA
jgi:CBS domain-containing protein